MTRLALEAKAATAEAMNTGAELPMAPADGGAARRGAKKGERLERSDRYHVRLNYVGHPNYFTFAAGHVVSASQNVVVGTPHEEVWDDGCKPGFLGFGTTGGHRTIDYSGSRDLVTTAMAREHPWEQVWYGNDNPQTQCADQSPSDARGDGLVNYIYSYPLSGPPDPCGATC